MIECNIKDISDQYRRASGQVTSIGRMIDDKRDCAEVLQQIVAARASLARLGILLLEFEAKGCLQPVAGEVEIKDLERIVAGLFKIT